MRSKALCYKPEGRGVNEVNEFFSIYLIHLAMLGYGVYSATKRNEYQTQKNGSGEWSAAVA
jgi:hypothetical protein